jgi:hypothetical protein
MVDTSSANRRLEEPSHAEESVGARSVKRGFAMMWNENKAF